MAQKQKTISFTKELDAELDNLLEFMNANKIDGNVNKSKLIRVAVLEFIEKQKKIQQILREHKEVNKSAEDLLKENGML